MFYLLLGCVLLTGFLVLGTYKVIMTAEIRKSCWSGKVQLVHWSRLFAVRWHMRSGSPQQLTFRFLFIPVRLQLSGKTGDSDMSTDQKGLRDQFKTGIHGYQKLKRVQPLIQQVFKNIRLYCLRIQGHISALDPATSGVIFGVIQWLRSIPVSPLDIQIYPRFYPGESDAECHAEMEFRLFSLLWLFFRHRHVWKPLISGT